MEQTFGLIVDNRVEIWRRDRVTIKAETLEEAISHAESGDYDYVYDTEYLSDTEIYLGPKDVDGFMTYEIMDAFGIDYVDVHKDNPTLLYYDLFSQ